MALRASWGVLTTDTSLSAHLSRLWLLDRAQLKLAPPRAQAPPPEAFQGLEFAPRARPAHYPALSSRPQRKRK